MSNLFHFLADLAINPRRQELFEQNPQLVMAAAGLSEKDQTALSSRDWAKITAAFADELETSEPGMVMIGCVYSDPGPDPSPDPDPLPDPSGED